MTLGGKAFSRREGSWFTLGSFSSYDFLSILYGLEREYGSWQVGIIVFFRQSMSFGVAADDVNEMVLAMALGQNR